MKTDNIFTLPDGRKLSYAEFGKSDGYPVLYFHGSPASRLEPLLVGEQDRNALIQLVRKVMTMLPNAQLVTYENEAHLSTPCNHLDEIASALVNE